MSCRCVPVREDRGAGSIPLDDDVSDVYCVYGRVVAIRRTGNGRDFVYSSESVEGAWGLGRAQDQEYIHNEQSITCAHTWFLDFAFSRVMVSPIVTRTLRLSTEPPRTHLVQ